MSVEQSVVDVPSIGIDLGSSTCCVAIVKHGVAETLVNEDGDRTTPSSVTFTDSAIVFGAPSRNQAYRAVQNTLFAPKHLLGKSFSDSQEVAKRMRMLNSLSQSTAGPAKFDVEYKGEKKQYGAEDVCGLLMGRMKEIAEGFYGKSVKHAVLAVPSYWSEAQRQAVKESAQQAGLQVLRLISESTAAVIACGLDISPKSTSKPSRKNVVVVDVGASKVDVTVTSVVGGVVDIKAVNSNTKLGGIDFDDFLVNYFVKMFNKDNKVDMTQSQKSMTRLRHACEMAKRQMSASSQAEIQLDALYEGIDLYSTITRAKFENLTYDLFPQVLKTVEDALAKARMANHEVDHVVLTGGASSIPKIEEMLTNTFGKQVIMTSSCAEELVAQGCAIQASLLAEKSAEDVAKVAEVTATSLTIGVETESGLILPLFPRGTPLPCAVQHTFVSKAGCDVVKDNFDVRLYQGERAMAKDNTLLMTVSVPASPSDVCVTFTLTKDGALQVSTDATGSAEATTAEAKGQGKSREEAEKEFNSSSVHAAADSLVRQTLTLRSRLAALSSKWKDMEGMNLFNDLTSALDALVQQVNVKMLTSELEAVQVMKQVNELVISMNTAAERVPEMRKKQEAELAAAAAKAKAQAEAEEEEDEEDEEDEDMGMDVGLD